ncbi:hypothetical protein ACFL35_16370 [Candidatus Riflebacteria bacterium]
MRLKIVSKIALLVGIITALASVTVGWMVHNGAVNIVFQQALYRLKYETNIKALELLSDIDTLGQDVHYLVGTPPVQGIARAQPDIKILAISGGGKMYPGTKQFDYLEMCQSLGDIDEVLKKLFTNDDILQITAELLSKKA